MGKITKTEKIFWDFGKKWEQIGEDSFMDRVETRRFKLIKRTIYKIFCEHK